MTLYVRWRSTLRRKIKQRRRDGMLREGNAILDRVAKRKPHQASDSWAKDLGEVREWVRQLFGGEHSRQKAKALSREPVSKCSRNCRGQCVRFVVGQVSSGGSYMDLAFYSEWDRSHWRVLGKVGVTCLDLLKILTGSLQLLNWD